MSDKLPQGWGVEKFTTILDINGGTQPPKKEFISEPKPGYIRLLQIRDFGKKPVPTYIPDNGKRRICKKEDILIGRYGASVGRICTGMEGAYNVALARVAKPDQIDTGFLKYFLQSHYFQHPLSLLSRSAQNGFNKQDLSEFDLLIAPLQEQTRIANKLDSLLAKVEAAQTRLEKIPTLLKRLRQSVLVAATSGDLTREWKEEQRLPNWKETVLEDLILTSANGLSKRRGAHGSDVTILRLADFKDARRIYGNERQIKLDDKENDKYSLKSGDILIIRVNGSVDLAGKFIEYIESSRVEGFCDHFIRIRLNTNRILPTFITYVANEGSGREYLKNRLSTSAGQNTINQAAVKSLLVSLPSLEEQKEIVRRIESLFALADSVEKQYTEAKKRTDRLTQSLLAKAFRGELVPQDPSDEPASELLKRIQADREVQKPAKESLRKKSAKKSTSLDKTSHPDVLKAPTRTASSKINGRQKNQTSVEEHILEKMNGIYKGEEVELSVLIDAIDYSYEELKKALFNLTKGDANTSIKPKAKLFWDGVYKISMVK